MSRSSLFLPAQGHYVRPRLRLAGPVLRIAWFGLILLIVSIPVYRIGGISSQALAASLLLAGALLLGAFAFALVGLARAWFQAARGGSRAFGAALVGFVGLLPFAFVVMLATENPPTNTAYTAGLAALQSDDLAGSLRRDGETLSINTLTVSLPARRYAAPPVEVIEAVQAAAQDVGWVIEDIAAIGAETESTADDAPLRIIHDSGDIPLPTPRASIDNAGTNSRLNLPAGELYTAEAVASDWLLGLPSDVLIQVEADGNLTIVDIRSTSREIGLDFGQNRRFIEAFFEALDLAMAGEEDIAG